MAISDENNCYEEGFSDGAKYALGSLVNEEQVDIPTYSPIWKEFFNEEAPANWRIVSIIEKERLRILKELDMIEKQSNDTRTPIYQDTLIRLMRDRINNG
jgi:hypothetical protein